ncbi:MAG: arsenic resistance N-acetyltransferase ArsN2 [Burkholderiales bacterium]
MGIRGQALNFFRPSLGAVHALLREAELPTADLTSAHLEHFIGCGVGESLAGVVGVELYPPLALLRSLAVAGAERSQGLGARLVGEAERHAREHGASEIYLLTTSAERFFSRAGYERIDREAAPSAIRATREFASLCPASAALMRKPLA